MREIDFKPATSIEDGIAKFVDWYKEYYQINDDKNSWKKLE